MSMDLLRKLITCGKLLEITKSTEAEKEYFDYFYNDKFYRVVRHKGVAIGTMEIKKENLSEQAIYNLTK